MTDGTHAQRIMELLLQRPGLDDDEIARTLGIEPRQTVNQICRRLAARGSLRRERGAGGKIVNVPGNGSAASRPPAASRAQASDRNTAKPGLPVSIMPSDLAKTLLILPCSGVKRDRGEDAPPGPAIAESLPPELTAEFLDARASVRQLAPFDETVLLPAWQRYDGALYQAGRQAIGDLMQAGAHVVILSGGYGALLATEPIGDYDARLTPSWWPQRILQRVLLAYAQHHGIAAVRAVVSATGPYVGVLQRVRWQDAGIQDALLITPEAEPGGLRRSPATQGEALTALRDGTLATDWQSSYGLGLNVRAF
ncbi:MULTISPECIES: hypothetical protein [unclassified Mesorhizobium]|uniref:hypothetical protein n=1 Tax=unclassified Mesorhizobium TaxID=325217 RepID=UPI0024161F71|nr:MULTISPECIES: hypothetical protein [unclassified Mesorhizobium]MDG4901410.1 hypothetical protein [Mesorhizobium sp. WSM4962]MDG4918898.1 hypothetical protein [Mesorhizobium sp. WSM4989]